MEDHLGQNLKTSLGNTIKQALILTILSNKPLKHTHTHTLTDTEIKTETGRPAGRH